MKYMITILKVCMNIIYHFFKMFKTKEKITFISRQSEKAGIDFILLSEEIKKIKPNLTIVILNKEIKKGIVEKIKYVFHMFLQMYHIATSKVVILDGYCIAISILNHKKDLTVIQLWHALGSLKKFGYSAVGKATGRSEKIAKLMNMHENYTYILVSSEISKNFFQEAFHAKEDQMLVMSLPRVDYLLSEQYKEEMKKEFYNQYKEWDDNKKNILYCPTHRQNAAIKIENVVNAVDLEKYNLIIKLHDGQEFVYTNNKIFNEKTHFTGMHLLHIADYIITDYSAIVYEASIVQKPIYFYTYDYDAYASDRGFYIDYQTEMPGVISKDIHEIINLIDENKWNRQKVIEFRDKYINDVTGNATNKLANFVLKQL